jgi:hypothetical protein
VSDWAQAEVQAGVQGGREAGKKGVVHRMKGQRRSLSLSFSLSL